MAETPQAPASPSPFRRRARQGLTESGADTPGFPWVQLVFCIACLSMMAWTWMRYSWVVDTTVENLIVAGWADETSWRHSPTTLVRFRGSTHYVGSGSGDGLRVLSVCSPDARNGQINVLIPNSQYTYSECFNTRTYEGRVFYRSVWTESGPRSYTTIDTTAPRLVPPSVAGLVVGVMGVFIFGLYLRRWLRERKAAA